MKLAPPTLPPIGHLPAPLKLRRKLQELHLDGVVPSVRDARREDEARAYLAERRRTATPRQPTRREMSGLIGLYASERSTEVLRAQIVPVLLSSSPSVSQLWSLWSISTDVDEPAVRASLLAQVEVEDRQSSSRLERFLPLWARSRPYSALSNPERSLVAWCEANVRTVDELNWNNLRVLPSSVVGTRLLRAALDGVSAQWWARQPPEKIRDWASSLPAPVLRVCADRLLRQLGSSAQSPSALPSTDDSRALRRWVEEHLGFPEQHPGRWADVSERGRQVFEWLVLRDVFDEILVAFRRGSTEDDRAEFWPDYFNALSDARYVQAGEVAVCMMRFGQALIIEFGTTGNATYVYTTGPSPPPLRSLPISRNAGPGEFKSKWRLRFGRTEFPFHAAWTHHSSWQYKFRTELHYLGVPEPRTR